MLNQKEITKKREKLEQAKKDLKSHFIGLDNVIDKIIQLIEIWYLVPEILTRPVIINLWGITGIGKTDLVRKLVMELDFMQSYAEIQFDTKNSNRTIQQKLTSNNILSNTPAVLLLDEIQKFSTIDNMGNPIRDTDYQDIWELLSDGSFSDAFDDKANIQEYIFRLLYDIDSEEVQENEASLQEADSSAPKKSNKKRKYQGYVWEAEGFKRLSESTLSIEEIMMLSTRDKIDILSKKLDSINITKTRKKYNQLLIFICGNLDNAYTMSTDVSNADISADVLYELSRSINIVKIKHCLSSQFKPEQIARLGNNHVIYTTLNQQHFIELINKTLSTLLQKFYEISNIKIILDDNVCDIIYDNGVYPTQGVRPVFSSIYALIETQLPFFILKGWEHGCSELLVSLNPEKKCIESTINNNTYSKSVEFSIYDIKKSIDKQKLLAVGVHEIGHTVVYMLLHKTPPVSVRCDGTHYEGFVSSHVFFETKENYVNQIKIALAGKVLEEIIFGNDLTTAGSTLDLSNATSIACAIIRRNNFDGFVGTRANNPEANLAVIASTEEDGIIVENLLKECKSSVFSLLHNHTELIQKLLKQIMNKSILMQSELYDIAKPYIPDLRCIPFDELLTHDYNKCINNYLGIKEVK
jgi:cell division protease FtsH